jgi:hypothetical protein
VTEDFDGIEDVEGCAPLIIEVSRCAAPHQWWLSFQNSHSRHASIEALQHRQRGLSFQNNHSRRAVIEGSSVE